MKDEERSLPPPTALNNVSDLRALLRRGRNDLVALWDAGDWMHRYFGGRPAEPGKMAELITALENDKGGGPASLSTLSKCKQIRRDWTRQEIEAAQKVSLPIRELNGLLTVKKQAIKSTEARKDTISGRLESLIQSRPTMGTAKKWNEAVAELKRFCRQGSNSGPTLKPLKEHGKATQTRVRAAIASLEKMKEYVPEPQLKTWKKASDAAHFILEQVEYLIKDAGWEITSKRGGKVTLQPYEDGL